MRIHILGSAAAEGWPSVWCNCKHCKKARAAGGKNLRSRSGALVDEVIKLDLCPDTYMQAMRDGVDLGKVTNLLITHAHPDHLTPAELGFHVPPFAHATTELQVWGSQQSIDAAKRGTRSWPNTDQRLHVVTPCQPFVLNDGTHVMPLPAKHDPGSGPLNYIIRRGGKTMFYGMDSGWYPDEAWAAHAGYVLDAVVIDCTHGDRDIIDGHGSLNNAIKVKETMLANGTAHAGTIFVANHFSHNGGMLHEEMEAKMVPAGFVVAYDGLVIEV